MSSPNLQYVIPILLGFLVISLIAVRWLHGWFRRAVRIAQTVAAGWLLICLLAYAVPTYGITLYDQFRPRPGPETRPLFQGITYMCDVRGDPRPTIIHIVTIDLDAPGIRFLVTPPDRSGGLELRAQTVSDFLAGEDAQLAVNAGFFQPWWDNSLVDFYPWPGQPVEVSGLAASNGDVYSEPGPHRPTLMIDADNRVTFGEASGPVYNAVSGSGMIVEEGRPANTGGDAYYRDLHPRTAVGLDRSGRTLMLVLVDGRQPGYSEGASIAELSAMLIRYGAWTALNLDGGGSTDLVIAAPDGSPQVLNAPIHNHIPGRERPIANHIGVFALRLAGAPAP